MSSTVGRDERLDGTRHPTRLLERNRLPHAAIGSGTSSRRVGRLPRGKLIAHPHLHLLGKELSKNRLSPNSAARAGLRSRPFLESPLRTDSRHSPSRGPGRNREPSTPPLSFCKIAAMGGNLTPEPRHTAFSALHSGRDCRCISRPAVAAVIALRSALGQRPLLPFTPLAAHPIHYVRRLLKPIKQASSFCVRHRLCFALSLRSVALVLF